MNWIRGYMSFGNKMIVASCPLRVSFLGGSTDLEDFIEEYGYGEVINFPINLYFLTILPY